MSIRYISYKERVQNPWDVINIKFSYEERRERKTRKKDEVANELLAPGVYSKSKLIKVK